jgi:hypothetical protein
MLFREIVAWSRRASPYSINSVAQVAVDAINAWPMRDCGNRELADLAPWCPSVGAWPVQWSAAAALAAAEMAIVCHIWPDPLNEVLRPAGIAGKNV